MFHDMFNLFLQTRSNSQRNWQIIFCGVLITALWNAGLRGRCHEKFDPDNSIWAIDIRKNLCVSVVFDYAVTVSG